MTQYHKDCSALALAVKKSHPNILIVQLLFQYGGDVNCKDGTGQHLTMVAALKGNVHVLKLVLSYRPKKEAKIAGNHIILYYRGIQI